MSAARFNPITYSHKLQDAGLDQKIAEVQAEELANLINNDVFTKRDGELLESNLRKEIKELELKMYGFIAKTATFTVGILGSLQIFFHFVK